ncbi:flagellar hook-associated protein FlgL [Alkalilimnicola sp. S0819]|uniref:flagellar hook-associated protein FlgL n=1 Tax=Alkalilimnicola sp. S0819 TaxID=2613922 RepID=UPI001261C46A|nr:flagellar hook-associated protein FlgL [Alkalilimnicola sp. S0819]KAB7627191.1 flagellar hook-associated protein 3 [Alkalilimnicola sp. S0819]MPQ15904.1 flagellar hook-associated protein 3 [Alkalilimnicola sp. S0819]
MRVSTNQYQQQSIFTILQQQAKLARTQEQLPTGRRILAPSDDPAGAARSLDLTKSIETIQRYSTNAERGEHRLRMEEATLESVNDALQRLRELTVQAKNGSQDGTTRGFAASETRELLGHLVELANSSDGNGEYLFAGTASKDRPFVRVGEGVRYQGDAEQRMIQVGPSRQVASNHSGEEVFMSIAAGDGHTVTADAGRFASSATLAAASTARVAGVAVTDPQYAASREGDYQIDVVDNAGTLEYTVTYGGNTSAPQPYVSGTPIEVNGYSFDVRDAIDTDSFTISTPAARNTGTGILGEARVEGDSRYTVQMGEDAQGNTTYSVSRDGGAFQPDPPALYEAGARIEVNGLSLTLEGEPAPGDRFTIEPSNDKSLFKVVEDLAKAFEFGGTGSNEAAFQNLSNRGLNELDQVMERLLQVRAENGSRLSALERERDANGAAVLELERSRSETRDLDIAEAVSQMTLQLTGLQAAQQSYVKIQGLTLFNYL